MEELVQYILNKKPPFHLRNSKEAVEEWRIKEAIKLGYRKAMEEI